MSNNEIVAISSLESPDHAMKKDPGILSVIWSLGKRCNYDCSYCSPFIHDNFSPHIKLQHVNEFLINLENHVLEKNKKIKIGLAGGEPFVHPQILDILKRISLTKNLTHLSVTSNGSLPLELYQEASKHRTNFTISLHLEQADNVIQSTIEKILYFNTLSNWFFTVNLMALPKKFDKVKQIVELFKNNNVKHIVRKIDPPIEFEKQQKPSKKTYKLDESLSEKKQLYKTELNKNLDINWDNYYSKEELEYLSSLQNNNWQNMRVYLENGNFVETNSDSVKIQSTNRYKDWHCFIGIDTIYIQDDGNVFRGYCMAGNKIGHISSKINWPKDSIVCPFKYCECAADIVTRKAKNTEFLPLIT